MSSRRQQMKLERPSRSELTHDFVRQHFLYNARTGKFIRLKLRGRGWVGAVAGTVNRHGYRIINIGGTLYAAHRLAWFYVTGEWPTNEIDHKDGDRDNNRWVNLRDVTPSVNQQNWRRAPAGKRSSPLLGASWSNLHQRWRAEIRSGGRRVHLGLFDTDVLAHEAYIAAKRRLHEGCTI